jgi:scyllo-inositol 2-dehydrogenase (NADP+)
MKKIKTALLSYGMSGKVFHAPFLNLHNGFELIGAWERSEKRIQNDFINVKSYGSIEDLLSDEIDLVIVNTQTSTHFEYAKMALLAGKHVLVEKAFTTNATEAQALDLLAKSLGLKLAVFQNRRWDSDFKTVQHIFESGVLGKLVEAEFHFDRYNPNLSPKKHKETMNDGAGILKDLGPHLIDQALCLFGFPNAVFADIRITRKNSLVDDYFDILLYYDDFRVRLKAGFFVKEPVASYALHGEKGSFLKTRGDLQEDELKLENKPNLENWGTELIENEGVLNVEINGDWVRKKIPTLKGNYYYYFDALYNAIVFEEKLPATAIDGWNVMNIIAAAIDSNLNARKIDLF